MTDSLIEKIGTLRASQVWTPPYLQAIDDCLDIIHQHEASQAEPPQDEVEWVAEAIRKFKLSLTYLTTPPAQRNVGLAKAAIAAMGTEKAVKSSTELEEFGTAPEAADLEPKCDQPVPAKSEISVITGIGYIADHDITVRRS